MGSATKNGRVSLMRPRKSRKKKWMQRRINGTNVTSSDGSPKLLNGADVSVDNVIDRMSCSFQTEETEKLSVPVSSQNGTSDQESIDDISNETVVDRDLTEDKIIDNNTLELNTNVDNMWVHVDAVGKVDVKLVPSAELDDEGEIADENVGSETCTANASVNIDCTEVPVNGRQVVDMGFMWEEIHRTFDDHAEQSGCRFRDWKLTKTRRRGFLTQFFFHCENCKYDDSIWSEDTGGSTLDANAAAVLGTVTTGIGFAQLEELFTAMTVECMSEKTYIKFRGGTTAMLERTAELKMKEAAEIEKKLAIESNDVLEDGTACITVMTDGSWAKRSYGTSYDSLSGVGFIVGLRSGKPLFQGIRNKFCTVCDVAARRGTESKPHKCYKNFDRNASSTSMESDAIVEGFNRSVSMYGLIYNKVIADGDSNLIKAIRDSDPYHKYGVQVQKIECTNHLLRNLCRKIQQAASVAQPKDQRQRGVGVARNAVKSKILAIRNEIVRAADRWSEAKTDERSKVEGLRRDILNVCDHVFGEHKGCGERECTHEENQSEKNLVPVLQSHGLYQKVLQALEFISCFSDSLLVRKTNNPVESCNAIVCKTIGGKRINFGLRDAYNGRVSAAVMQFDSQQVLTDCYQSSCSMVPRNVRLFEERRKRKIAVNREARAGQGRRSGLRNSQGVDKYYGPNSQKPDLDEAEYERIKEDRLKELAGNAANWKEIECDTREQCNSERWHTIRRRMLTASNFGAVCRKQPKTSCKNLVRHILYPSIPDAVALKYGREQEKAARKQLAEKLKKNIRLAGLFIDEEQHFLGASPDGLIDEDGLVEIKCPFTAKHSTMQEAAAEFKHMKGVFEKKNEKAMSKKHKFFYQVQGQLHVTKRDYCIFAVWSPNYMKCIRVERDDEFWKKAMNEQLNNFFYDCMLPEIIDSRHNRSMPIRDPQSVLNARVNNMQNKIAAAQKKEASNDLAKLKKSRKRRLSEVVISEGDDEVECLGEIRGTGLTAKDAAAFREWFDHTIHRPEDIRMNVEPVENRLNDDSIDTFLRLVREKYGFVTQSVHYVNSPFPTMIDPVTNQRTIQIFGGKETDHWRCLYFDGSKLRIYDSLGSAVRNKFTEKEQKYIGLRYPTVRTADISFERVQHQPSGVGCGVYAAAYATSIVLGCDPCSETYSNDEKLMRQHFLHIVESGSLALFPRN